MNFLKSILRIRTVLIILILLQLALLVYDVRLIVFGEFTHYVGLAANLLYLVLNIRKLFKI